MFFKSKSLFLTKFYDFKAKFDHIRPNSTIKFGLIQISRPNFTSNSNLEFDILGQILNFFSPIEIRPSLNKIHKTTRGGKLQIFIFLFLLTIQLLFLTQTSDIVAVDYFSWRSLTMSAMKTGFGVITGPTSGFFSAPTCFRAQRKCAPQAPVSI